MPPSRPTPPAARRRPAAARKTTPPAPQGTRKAARKAPSKRGGARVWGEDHPASVLTARQVLRFRRLVRTGKATIADLAREVGSSHGRVSMAVRGHTWRTLDAQEPPVGPSRAAAGPPPPGRSRAKEAPTKATVGKKGRVTSRTAARTAAQGAGRKTPARKPPRGR